MVVEAHRQGYMVISHRLQGYTVVEHHGQVISWLKSIGGRVIW